MHLFPQTVFVAGIGTGVGKTLVSAILTETLGADYWKPIQAGNLNDSDSMLVQSLLSNKTSQIHPEAYRLQLPASPHYAAKTEEVHIDLDSFQIPETKNRLVIEAAGGLMVPINDEFLVLDLILRLNVPVVLVVRNYLGSINHTLLSIELLRQRRASLLGIIYSGDNYNDNEEIISRFGNAPVLGRIEEAKQVNKEFVMEQAIKLKYGLLKQFEL